MIESIELVILKKVQKLSFEWFRLKEVEFRSHPNYDDEKKEIIIDNRQEIQTSSLLMPGSEDEPFVFTEQWTEVGSLERFDLQKYCNAYFPLDASTTWGFYPPPPSKFPSNYQKKNHSVIELADELVVELSEILSLKATAKETYNFVMLVNQIAKSEVNKLRNITTLVTYHKVLDDFELKLNELLHKKYRNELFTAAISFQSDDHLKFKIGQEELASLLALLEKAGILEVGNGTNDRRQFFEFCQRYFHFAFSGSYKRPQTVKSFRDKFGEASTALHARRADHLPLKRLSEQLLSAIRR